MDSNKRDKEIPKKGFFANLIEDVKENISEGTKVLGEKSAEVFEVVKEKSEEAYKAGAGVVGTVNEKVHDFSEKQKLQKEWKGYDLRRNELVTEFGEEVLEEYFKNGSVTKRFLTKKAIQAITDNIKSLDEKMESINEKLSA